MKVLNSNILICEYVDYDSNILNIEGVFTETKAAKSDELLNRPFNIYIDSIFKKDDNESDSFNNLFVIMEAEIGSKVRYKLLKEIEITKKMRETSGVNHLVNIIRFTNRRLLKSPGVYNIRVYATTEEKKGDNIKDKLQEIIADTNKIIIGQQILVVEP